MMVPTLTNICKRFGNNHYILYVGCKPPPRMPVKNEGLVLSSWLVMIESWGGGKPHTRLKVTPWSSSPEAILYVRRQPFIFAKYPRHPTSSHAWWGWVWREPLKRPSPHEMFGGLNRHRSSRSVGQDVYRGICCIKMEFVFVVLRRGMADPLIWGPPLKWNELIYQLWGWSGWRYIFLSHSFLILYLFIKFSGGVYP